MSRLVLLTRALGATASPFRMFAIGTQFGTTATPEGSSTGPGWGQTLISDVLKLKEDEGKWLFCSKDDTVFTAISKMAKANVGSLLVFDASKIGSDDQKAISSSAEAVCGIMTERDYLTKVACEGRSSKDTKVEQIMTSGSKLITVTPRHTVLETMEIMADHNVRHLPVVEQHSMMGMVSVRDLVKVMVREHRSEMANMQRYIQGMY